MKTVFFVFDKPMHGNVQAQEFLDMALMAAAFEQRTVIVFEGEGVLSLVKRQEPEVINLKNIAPLLNALPVYDITEVLVEKEALDQWRLVSDSLLIPVSVLTQGEISQQIQSADHVFGF